MARRRATDPTPKHDECVEKWGECPHWLLSMHPLVVTSRIKGISESQFEERDVSAHDFLDEIESVAHEMGVDLDVDELVERQHTIVDVRAATSQSELAVILAEVTAEDDPDREVVAAINRRQQQLRAHE